jgi:membrane protease YdiL (CAAX protease family)
MGFKRSPIWSPILAIALPVAVFFGAGTWNWLGSEGYLLAIAAGCALVNGPLEELAWRRPFRANSEGQLSFELFGLFLFALWHVPLYFLHGVSFDHDAAGLIGGAFFLGLVWMMMTRASNAIGWPMLSHAFVNYAGFIGLFAANFGA